MIYKKSQVKNNPTEANLLLAKQIYQLIYNKSHVILRDKSIKSGTIHKKYVNKNVKSEGISIINRNWNVPRKRIRVILKQTRETRL